MTRRGVDPHAGRNGVRAVPDPAQAKPLGSDPRQHVLRFEHVPVVPTVTVTPWRSLSLLAWPTEGGLSVSLVTTHGLPELELDELLLELDELLLELLELDELVDSAPSVVPVRAPPT